MRVRARRRMHPAFALLAGVLMVGCAPARFEQAVAYQADRHRVTRADTRHVGGLWHLRFNALMISDLDEAIGQADASTMRTRATDVLRAANRLGQKSGCSEIDRLPPAARESLAEQAGTAATAEALKKRYRQLADAAIEQLVHEVATLPADRLRRKLRHIRRHIEPAPDDRGRLFRQVLLAWAAVPAWIGVGTVEAELEAARPAKLATKFQQAAVWHPNADGGADPLGRFAPIIAMEWPAERGYAADADRLGTIHLSGTPEDLEAQVDLLHATIYTYTSEAKIHGRRYPQLVYNWWFPQHPAMRKGDPSAGHMDGDVLRVTLDGRGRPAVFEVVQCCGCNHMVFVAQHVEDAARAEFGAPLPHRRFVVEADVPGKRDLIVAGTVRVPDHDAHLVVSVLAGCHEVIGIDCITAPDKLALNVAESHSYAMEDYEVLEHLPLGDRVASLFGPYGLVHKAGRTEGLLLAPTGILSAGQPRERGTRNLRWDEYDFDDPHLLERTLRLPERF